MNRIQLVAALLLGTACATQQHPEDLATRQGAASPPRALDDSVPAWLTAYDVPGMAVAYIKDGRVQWTRVYGDAPRGVRASDTTRFNVASLTKPVFAELVLHLATAGKLDLDEPMAPTWVDPDVRDDPRHKLLTPRRALSHRTGFPNWRRETGGKLRFQRHPGTAYGYSGEGFEYLKEFITRRMHAPLDSLGLQWLLRPFGMRSSAFSTDPGGSADNFRTTIGDYATFLVHVMDRSRLWDAFAGQRDSLHVVDPSGTSFCAGKIRRCPTTAGYGLGWSVLRYPSADDDVLWHTGADPDVRTMVFWFPARREGAVFFTNGANGFQPIIAAGTLLFAGTPFAEYLAAGREQK